MTFRRGGKRESEVHSMKVTKTAGLFLLVLLMVGLAACQKAEPPDLTQPPAIEAGVSTVFGDERVIEDLQFAAAYYTVDGEARLFDDAGRMVTHLEETEVDVASKWVADFDTGVLLPANEAIFVVSPTLVTPRGTGTIALATLERAQKVALQNQGQVIALAALPAFYAAAAEFNALPLPAPDMEFGGLMIANDGK